MPHTSFRYHDKLHEQVLSAIEERGIRKCADFYRMAIRNELRRHQENKLEQRLAKELANIRKSVRRVSATNRAVCALLVEFFRSQWSATSAPHQVQLRITQILENAEKDFSGEGLKFFAVFNDDPEPSSE